MSIEWVEVARMSDERPPDWWSKKMDVLIELGGYTSNSRPLKYKPVRKN